MKKLLALALVVGAMNSGFAADLYVNNSGQSGTYSTINLALAAASAGDRIFVSPMNFYAEDLTITKSITIAPTDSDAKIALSGTIYLQPIQNMKVTLSGIEMNGLGLSSVTSTSTITDPAFINLISCRIQGSCNFLAASGLKLTIHDTHITGFLYAKHLEMSKTVVGSNLTIDEEANQTASDSIKIIASYVGGNFTYSTKDYYLFMSNCYINGQVNLYQIPNYQLTGKSVIRNTLIRLDMSILYYPQGTLNWTGLSLESSSWRNSSAVYLGTTVTTILNSSKSTGWYGSSSYPYYYLSSSTVNNSKAPNVLYCSSNSGYSSLTPAIHPNIGNWTNVSGANIYNNTFTYVAIPNTSSVNITESSWLSQFNNSSFINAGSPSSNFVDLDLTRNDIGILGGSHSWLNYWYNETSTTGNAVIRWIDLPSEIWPGQTVNLKAEAVHTN